MEKQLLITDEKLHFRNINTEGVVAGITFMACTLLGYLFYAPDLLGQSLWLQCMVSAILVGTMFIACFPRLFDMYFLVSLLALMILSSAEWMRVTTEYHIFYQLEFAYAAMLGKIPFVDIQNPYGPIADSVLGVSMRLFGPTQIVVQLTTIVVVWIGMVCLYCVGKKVMPQWATAFSCILTVALLGTVVIPWRNYFLFTISLIFFSFLIGAFFDDRSEQNNSRRKYISFLCIGGLFGGLLPWTAQYAVLPTISGVIGWLLLNWLAGNAWKVILRSTAYIVAGISGSFLGILVIIASKGGFYNIITYYIMIPLAIGPAGDSSDLRRMDILSLIRRLFTYFSEIKGYYWQSSITYFMDYGLILLALFIAAIIPFWIRFVTAPSLDSKSTNISKPVAASFLAAMIIIPRLPESYPIFESFRLAAIFSAGIFVVVVYLYRICNIVEVNRRFSWILPIPIIILLSCLAVRRFVDFSKIASSSLILEWSGYPKYMRSNLNSPAMQGMLLAPKPASHDALSSYILDGYQALFPKMPVIGGIHNGVRPGFLVGRREYNRGQSLMVYSSRWPKEVQDVYHEKINAFIEHEGPLIFDSSSMNMLRFYPAANNYGLLSAFHTTPNYIWGQEGIRIISPLNEMQKFKDEFGMRYSLNSKDSLTDLAASSKGIFSFKNGNLYIVRSGILPLTFVTSLLGEKYPNLQPWMLVALDNSEMLTNNNEKIALRFFWSDADIPTAEYSNDVIERKIDLSSGQSAFLQLDRAGPGTWFIEFPENSVGLCLSKLELHALTPDSVIATGFYYTKEKKTSILHPQALPRLGYEKRSSWIQNFGIPFNSMEILVQGDTFAQVGVAIQTTSGSIASDSMIEVKAEIVSDSKTSVTVWEIPEDDLNRWLDRELDLSGFNGEKVILRFEVQAENGKTPSGLSGKLCIEAPIMTFALNK